MSANNQTLIKKHENRYYVFKNIMAESWDNKNELTMATADGSFIDYDKALAFARDLDEEDDFMGTEYGVVEDVLYKDDAPVTLI